MDDAAEDAVISKQRPEAAAIDARTGESVATRNNQNLKPKEEGQSSDPAEHMTTQVVPKKKKNKLKEKDTGKHMMAMMMMMEMMKKKKKKNEPRKKKSTRR